MGYVRRTAVTRLSVEEPQREALEETIREWKRGCQLATEMAWNRCHTKRDVQSLAYDAIREKTTLGSQHAILATHQAADAISGCIERERKGRKTSKPRFTASTVTYHARTMTLFDDGTVSLATVGDRIRCPLALPDDEDGYQWQFLDGDEWELTESTLKARDGTYFLHLGFRRPKTERTTAEDGTVLGVDLGIENLAVTSTACFVNGRQLTHRLRELEKTRAGLQQTGTRSAHRTLERASGRELRYVRDVLQNAANEIVNEARRYDCDVIAMEDLSEIRTHTQAPWGHRWAFRTLTEYATYKAEAVGIIVEQVDPANTSRQCAECGFTTAENRRSRDAFSCQECDAEANADYNAAKNIGMRHVRRGHQSSQRTGDGRLALKSGTVTPNGGFTAYPDGFEAEFTDESSPTETKS